MKSLVALILLVLVVGSIFTVAGASGNSSNGPITVSGPSSVAVNSTFNYSVNVQQIFKNYSVAMIVSGYNLTNAKPVSPSYENNITVGPTVFEVTAPSVATTMFLLFEVKGHLNGRSYYYNLTSTVKVKTFTTLQTAIKNPTEFQLTNVNVTFKVNGKYVGATIVNISKNSTSNVTYEWVSGRLSPGIYSVTVLINSTVVKLQNGNTYTFKILSGNPYTIYIYIGIIAFFAIIIAVSMISGYYARKRRPKWKK